MPGRLPEGDSGSVTTQEVGSMLQMRIQHVALSVRDIAASGPWYQALFGFQKVAEFADPRSRST